MLRRFFSTNAPASTVLVRLLVGSVFLFEGIQKFLYPPELARGALYQNRYPCAGNHGPIRRWVRNCLRRTPDNWIANPARSDCASHRHQRGDSFDKNSDLPRPRFLGFLPGKATPLWFLEHDARGEDGFLDVVWPPLSAHRWCRKKVVAGCSDCVAKEQLS
jgi:hypothetical protein